jgi:ABC-type dipeptide/oligopeptide/nickel transport system ATPase component
MSRKRFSHKLEQPPVEIIRGAQVKAEYRDQEVAQFRDNPLNEALPPTLTPREATEYLLQLPQYSDKDREMSQVARLQMTETAREFFVPNGKHLTVYYAITNMIYRGYVRRNPVLWEYWKRVHHNIKSFLKAIKEKPFPNSRARGLAIVGSGGTGKSTTVEKILQSLPQVITHVTYKGRDFIMKQLVWLKLDCPRNGSLREFCINFFRAADEILGTQYEKSYARNSHQTLEGLIAGMARVAANQCLGIIVIDEIQDLSEARSGGDITMVNFFVHLENAIGIPFALIGTQDAIPILSSQFRQTRRVSEQGYIVWDRMSEIEPEIEEFEEYKDDAEEEEEIKPNISAETSADYSKDSENKKKVSRPDPVWKNFVETLWMYQYVTQPRTLNDNVVEDKCAHTLYKVAKGIPAVVQTVFVLTQQLAILNEEEKITPRLIHESVRINLQVINEMLGEARMKKLRAIKPVGDLADMDQIYEAEDPSDDFPADASGNATVSVK